MFEALAHLLIPRPSNNHKAKLIQSSTLAIITLLVIFSQSVFGLVGGKTGQVLGYAANISPSEVERLTNVQRASNGLAPVTDNPVLDSGALAKGRDMLAKGYWAHVAPDGTQPWAFFISAGYSYRYAGENLARDFSDAQSAVNAWMASPTHRANVRSANYKEIGIGVVEGNLAGVDTTIIVQFFGTKLGDTVSAPIAQAATAKPTIKPTQTPTLIKQTPIATAIAVATATLFASPSPTPPGTQTLVASNVVSPFDITRYVSMGLVATLIVVVIIDGFLINRRKIFRVAGHFPAHFAFLGMILVIVVLAKVGRII